MCQTVWIQTVCRARSGSKLSNSNIISRREKLELAGKKLTGLSSYNFLEFNEQENVDYITLLDPIHSEI